MNARTQRLDVIGNPRRLLIKVGSSVLTTARGTLNHRRVHRLADQVAELHEQGRESIIVSSGAIAAGVGELRLGARPKTMPGLQAAAAVGQSRLIQAYAESFRRHGIHVGQVLLGREDMEDRRRFLNTRNTLRALLDCSCVPIINENDSVFVEEIRYGDNDFLAAHLATVVLADLVVLLTNVGGLYETDERGRRRIVRTVPRVSDDVLGLDRGDASARGTGGMATKLRAAATVTRAGVPVVVANGRERSVLLRIIAGEGVGTLFLPARRQMASRKRWIGFTARSRGGLVVDQGARRALVERGKSLLASGVRAVSGRFEKGDVVSLSVEGAGEFARGLANYDSAEVALIQGCHTREIEARIGYKDYDEVVHRDNLVLVD
jgi:glutamate 5-kinase